MSLLLKALKQADRGSTLALEPMEQAKDNSTAAPPASAKATVDLMFEKHAAAEKQRLLILLGTLGAVALAMGVYFYLAVFMPWIFLPKPPASMPVPALAAPPAPPPEILPPLTQAVPVPSTPAAEPVAPAPPAKPSVAPRPRASAPSVAPADGGIQIANGDATPHGNGIVTAYRLLQEGRLDDARRAYETLHALEPRNPDVLLGLALIAQRQGRNDDAVQYYLKTLDVDPRNTFAQASLTGMIARADPQAAEAKFKTLIAQQPTAFLQFGLGNVYAAQGRWSEAQNAYFEAQRMAPDAPDYAFNLAISLEHLHQPRAALDYYRRALKLMQTSNAAFDAAQVKSRIQQLSNLK